MKISLVPLLFLSTCYSLSRFCAKLKHLDLTSCVSITNSSLKGIRYEDLLFVVKRSTQSYEHLGVSDTFLMVTGVLSLQ